MMQMLVNGHNYMPLKVKFYKMNFLPVFHIYSFYLSLSISLIFYVIYLNIYELPIRKGLLGFF